MFQENWEWILPYHLQFFKPKTLAHLVKRVGFEKVVFYQVPTPIYYPGALGKCFQNNPSFIEIWDRIPIFIKIFLFSPIILAGMLLNMNDNMTIICRKKSVDKPSI